MIAKIDEVKTLVKHISYDCKCKLDSKKCNSNQKLNNDKCQCKYRKYLTGKKGYGWNPSMCICENSRYLKVLLIIQ